MATDGYPKVTLKAWRALRSRAASAPSTKFTPATVAALMQMSSPESAATNTVAPLRRLGLITDDGSLTARGHKWRVDASYADACKEILDEVYPTELLALTDGSGAPDLQRVRTWFDHKGFGASNARQMAATLGMIASKTVPDERVNTERQNAPAKGLPSRKSKAVGRAERPQAGVPSSEVDLSRSRRVSRPETDIHLDIQIHIPAEATTEQIDKIFESMARHLYNK